jgi:hypothetical protein
MFGAFKHCSGAKNNAWRLQTLFGPPEQSLNRSNIVPSQKTMFEATKHCFRGIHP